MSEIEQRRKQLPRGRALKAAAAAKSNDGTDAARAAQVRRNAWLLGGLAVLFYVGYIAWMFVRSGGG